MGTTELAGCSRTIEALVSALAEGRVSSEALVSDYLDAIRGSNLNAFVELAADALPLARRADVRRRAGRALSRLDGIPLAVKDLFDVAGLPTRGGSRSQPMGPVVASAQPVRRLQDAGMIVLGKTATVELGCGGWGTQSISPVPRNPWDREIHRVPGGSSSGSAVAVAGGLAPIALGSDTGGSIRIPAGFCGIVGFKPSPGLISLEGAIPYSRTHDTVGLLGLTVGDVRTVFRAMLDYDGIFNGEPVWPLAGPSVGQLADDQLRGVAPDVADLYRGSLAKLARGTCRLDRFSCPETFERYSALAGELALQEAHSIYGPRIERAPELFCPVVRERILGGARSRDHATMIMERQRQQARFNAEMRGFDLIALPTCPAGAIPLSEVDEARSPSPFGRFANYLDLPALSIPIGVTSDGLPVGLQFAARRNADAMLLSFGEAVARRLDVPLPDAVRRSGVMTD